MGALVAELVAVAVLDVAGVLRLVAGVAHLLAASRARQVGDARRSSNTAEASTPSFSALRRCSGATSCRLAVAALVRQRQAHQAEHERLLAVQPDGQRRHALAPRPQEPGAVERRAPPGAAACQTGAGAVNALPRAPIRESAAHGMGRS